MVVDTESLIVGSFSIRAFTRLVFPVPDGAEITYKCPVFITLIVIEDFVPAL